MSTAARRAHTHRLRRRLLPGPPTIMVQIRGDASRMRRATQRATQQMAEYAEAMRRAQESARPMWLWLREFLHGPPHNDGDLRIFTVTTQSEGCRLIVQRVGGWQRMQVPTDERSTDG